MTNDYDEEYTDGDVYEQSYTDDGEGGEYGETAYQVDSTPAAATDDVGADHHREDDEAEFSGEGRIINVNGVDVVTHLPPTPPRLLPPSPNRLPHELNLPAAHNPAADAPRFGVTGVYAALIGAQACWSGFHLFAKIAFESMSPFVMPMIRTLGVTPIMFAIGYSQDRNFWRIDRRDFKILALIGFLVCGVCQNLFNVGLMLTTTADGGITQPAIPVFAALLSIALKRETPSKFKFLGIGLAILGTVCIVVGETVLTSSDDTTSISAGRRLAGIACFMIQCFVYAIYLILQKSILERRSTITVTFYTFLTGIPWTVAVGSYFASQIDGPLPGMWYVSVIYTILVASIAAFLLFAYAAKHLPASVSSLGISLQPFFSSVLGAMVLGDVLTYMHVIGGVFLIGGLVVVLWARSREGAKTKFQDDLEMIRATQTQGDADLSFAAIDDGTPQPDTVDDAAAAGDDDDSNDLPPIELDDEPSSVGDDGDAGSAYQSLASPDYDPDQPFTPSYALRPSGTPLLLPSELDHNPARVVIDDAIATGSSARRASDKHARSVAQKIRAKVRPDTMPLSTLAHPRLGPSDEDPFQ